MSTKIRYLFVLVFLVLFVAACSNASQTDDQQSADGTQDTASLPTEQNNEPATMPDINGQKEPEQKDEVATSEKISMDKIYNYAAVSKFTYDLTTSAAGQTVKTTFDYTLSSDTVDGKAAWLSTSEMETQGMTVLSKVWTDKTTFGCLKVSSVVNFNGQDMETPAECPAQGPGASTTATTTPELDYVGMESVTVPLGTFSAKKYVLDNTITYWYTDSVPIPVKVAYDNAGTIMELVKWS